MIPAVIELHDLKKTYRSGDVEVRALDGVTMAIMPGEFVAIMGASGSGKSTLMNLLGCLDQPSEGSYHLDGVDVASLGRARLAQLRNQKIGFVFQNFNLLPRTTARENVELPMLYTKPLTSLRERKHRAIEALRKVNLGGRLDHRPNELSGGQQQRVAIARALVNRPELLLADEPTGNLDSRTGIEIMELFQELNEAGITIVVVTHEVDIATYTRRIILMRDGHVISDVPNSNRRIARQERGELEESEGSLILA